MFSKSSIKSSWRSLLKYILSSLATIALVMILIMGASTGIYYLNSRSILFIVFSPVTGSMLIKLAMCISDRVLNIRNWPYLVKILLNSSRSVGKKLSPLSNSLSSFIRSES